jgi:MFS family permease
MPFTAAWSSSMRTSKVWCITVLAVCEVLAMALWFSASAVVPSLKLEYGLSGAFASLLTSSVQAGFVVGTLVSALFAIADRVDPRRFFMVSTLVAVIANTLVLAVSPDSVWIIVLRFITGACMAGVYPVGMKLAASWAKGDLGLLVGIMVGALTLGSAAPHLLNVFGGIDWRFTIAAASCVALMAAVLINATSPGPHLGTSPRIDPRYALKAWTTPSLRLANLGYLGHMWELYAMWAWLIVFLDASFQLNPGGQSAPAWASLATFAAVGLAGAAGCLAGGFIADRWGRTLLTSGAMTLSGACAILIGIFYGGAPWLLILLCLVWGFAVIADSAQFSASVAELADSNLIGTMLTAQTCGGFLLTLVTIHLMPGFVELVGWSWAFAFLAIGPAIGVWAMLRLRAHPDAVKLAGGRR